jgi:hypothetical protein
MGTGCLSGTKTQAWGKNWGNRSIRWSAIRNRNTPYVVPTDRDCGVHRAKNQAKSVLKDRYQAFSKSVQMLMMLCQGHGFRLTRIRDWLLRVTGYQMGLAFILTR